MKKFFGLSCLCLLFLFLSADNALVQEENQKEPPVQEIVYAEIEQVDPQIQALADQLKYYRTIGDIEKANEIWQELMPLINYEPEKYETGEEKVVDVMVIDSVEGGEREGAESEGWWSTDPWVLTTANNDKSTSMEVVTGHGTNNPNMYIAAEKWTGTTSLNNIMLKRSDNHGTSWPSTTAYQKEITSSYQLSLPKMKQIHPNYLGTVYQLRYSSTDFDIYWVKQSWDFTSSTASSIDASTTYHHRPDITSDYEDYGSGAYIYVVYFEGNPPTKLLFRRSLDGGATWSAAQTLATFTTSTQSSYPHCSIDYENDDLFVAFTRRVWTGFSYPESIAVVKSDSYGSTWSSPTTVSIISAAAYYPSITAVGATVVTAYEYPYTSTDMDIHYSYSLNSGTSWTTNYGLGTSVSNEYRPIVRSGVSTYIHCAYNLAPTQIYLRRATSAAPTSWTSLGNVKNSTRNIAIDDIPGLAPKLTPTGSTTGVAVSWAEYYSSTYGYDVAVDASWQSCVPGAFSNVSPADNVTNVPVTAIIDWGTSSGATSYDVYFGTSSSPPFVGTTTLTYWDPPGSMAYSTHYYWRAIAKNSCGSTYGSIWDFTTAAAPVVPPTVTTNTTVTSITALGAVCGGNVTSSGGATVTARGVCWDTVTSPTIADPHTHNGTGTGVFASTLTGLTPNTHYYLRAYATNSAGTAYGAQREFTTLTWIKIPGTLASLVVGDFNNNGTADLAGLNASGAAYYTTNLSSWTSIPGITFSSLVVGDFNNNGTADLAGLTGGGSVYYTLNLSTWINIPGTLVSLAVGDFNNNGTADLAGLNASGRIYYTTNLISWNLIPTGKLASLVAGDFNGPGTDDLAGLTATGSVYYTLNLGIWTRVLGTLAKLAVGDFNNNGTADLAGLNASGRIYYSTNLSTWINIPGTLASLAVGDFISTGPDDLAGLNAFGHVYYSTNLSSWTRIPGVIAKLVVGDFNNDGRDDLAGLNAGGAIYYIKL